MLKVVCTYIYINIYQSIFLRVYHVRYLFVLLILYSVMQTSSKPHPPNSTRVMHHNYLEEYHRGECTCMSEF